METTSRPMGPTADRAAGQGAERSGRPSVLDPLLEELQRISGHAESQRAAADQALIAELRAEIAALRAAVAHLRAGTAVLPVQLRPVVARAMLANGPAAAHDGRAATG